jgi:ribosome maturation factor RimP
VSASASQQQLLEAIEPQVQALGFECVEVVFAVEAGRRILRVLLDSPHGVTLDECASVSRALGPLLDDSAEVAGSYTLEVSSPGINRPLTKPEHFRRFLGERVKIRLKEKLDGGLTVSGILRDLQSDVVVVDTTVGPKQVSLHQIARARLHRDLDAILRSASQSRGREGRGADPGRSQFEGGDR